MIDRGDQVASQCEMWALFISDAGGTNVVPPASLYDSSRTPCRDTDEWADSPMLSSPGTDPGTTGTEGSEMVFTQHNGLMNCREFRRKHDAYIDDTLSGVDLERVARHRSLCETCARLDTRVRRSLLIARNLPIIQPSPAFHERLQTRLAAERTSIQMARTAREQLVDRRRPFGVGTYAAIAAGWIYSVVSHAPRRRRRVL